MPAQHPKWHIAYCNVTISEYAGMTYREYYSSPAATLEAQLIARDKAEEKFGAGDFIKPHIDVPGGGLAEYLGMPLIESAEDELPYVDTGKPLLNSPADVKKISPGELEKTGFLRKRLKAWEYYRSQGHTVGFGGHSGAIVTTAHEISAGNILLWMYEDPPGSECVLDEITEANLAIRKFSEKFAGPSDGAYAGDDFAGLISPEMFKRFMIPQYERIYAGRNERFLHSELLCSEHLRIARDCLGINCFHGAGCENLSLEEMRDIMGHDFWTQLTPGEMLQLSPEGITERLKMLTNSGCAYVQLYPGRNTPDINMKTAIFFLQRECIGGRV